MNRSNVDCWQWAAVVLAVSVVGCGSGADRVPVSGQVLIDGQPLTTGTIMVAPADARPAFGQIDSNGKFTLTTTEEGDGCVKGTHRATVTSTEILNPNETRLLIPYRYSDLSISNLTVTIDGPTEDLLVELEWGGERPTTVRTESGGDIDPSAM